MKINIPVRFKNPWFWVGVGGIILTAMDVRPEMFTNWQIVGIEFFNLINNPFKLFSVALAVLGVFVDPTTSGVTDSKQALSYQFPSKDK